MGYGPPVDPVFLSLAFLVGALVSDASRGPVLPQDLRSAILAVTGPNPASFSKVIGRLRAALENPEGRALVAGWPRGSLLPNPGYSTPFGGLVGWFLRQSREFQRLCSLPSGIDAPHRMNLIRWWWAARGFPDLDAWSEEAVMIAVMDHQEMLDARWRHRAPVPSATALASWSDGARIDRLDRPRDLDAEGISSEHCLRRSLHYWNEIERGEIVIVSYRDPDGAPQVTTEVDITGPEPVIVQLQGSGNGHVQDPLARERLAWWLVDVLRIEPFALEPRWAERVGLGHEEMEKEIEETLLGLERFIEVDLSDLISLGDDLHYRASAVQDAVLHGQVSERRALVYLDTNLSVFADGLSAGSQRDIPHLQIEGPDIVKAPSREQSVELVPMGATKWHGVALFGHPDYFAIRAVLRSHDVLFDVRLGNLGQKEPVAAASGTDPLVTISEVFRLSGLMPDLAQWNVLEAPRLAYRSPEDVVAAGREGLVQHVSREEALRPGPIPDPS